MLQDTSGSFSTNIGGGIPSSRVQKRESLAVIADRLKKRMGSSATAPLIAAGEVMDLAAEWERYEAEAQGLGCDAWLRKTFGRGRGLRWFELRYHAVQTIGEHARRTWDHEAAVWALGKFQPDDMRKLDAEVQAETIANNRNPLTEMQVRRIAKGIFGQVSARPHTCTRCKLLEAALVAAGVEVPK